MRALAHGSAAAAREIKGLITSSVEQVGQGTRVVHDAGRAVEEIVGSAHRMRELLAAIAVGASE
jgi:methyl-accepting chemotaxis protein